MQFRTLLFDLDGTLIDHFAAIHRSYSYTLPQLGLPAPTLAQVRNAVGGGLENAMLNFVRPDQVAAAVQIYRPYWNRTMLDDVVALPGALDLLRTLHTRGLTLAIFTNKHAPSSRLIADRLGFTPFLAGNFGAQDTPWLKPDPAFTAHVLTTLHADAATTLLIGDSPFDVQAARNAGFPCWAVTTGTHAAAELQAAGATRVFATLAEVQTALND
jgi:phosphoglycolate phosphatase